MSDDCNPLGIPRAFVADRVLASFGATTIVGYVPVTDQSAGETLYIGGDPDLNECDQVAVQLDRAELVKAWRAAFKAVKEAHDEYGYPSCGDSDVILHLAALHTTMERAAEALDSWESEE